MARSATDFPGSRSANDQRWSKYHPRLVEPGDPDTSAARVRTPSGAELDVLDPALVDDLGGGLRLIKQSRGVFDTLPISLITSQTLEGLGALLGTELDVARFRPNLVVAATGGAEFPEDAWVGSELQIGAVRLRIDKRDQRCAVVNVDPTTARRDPSVLRMIGAARAACLGVYGSIVRPGRIAIGDAVILG
jgi:hypothetical protein